MKEVLFVPQMDSFHMSPWLIAAGVAVGLGSLALLLIQKFEQRVSPGRRHEEQEIQEQMREGRRDRKGKSPFDFGISREHVNTHGMYSRHHEGK